MVDLIIPDVSHWQGKIDWPKLRTATPAVIIKAANDTSVDSFFHYNQAEARRAGFLYIGYYQYLNDTADAIVCARALQHIVGSIDGNRENLILDLEEGGGNQAPRLDAWNNTIPGETEIDYSGLAFWKTRLAGATTAKHRWIAAYRHQEPGETHTLWQYTDKQAFPGIAHPCDASVFHGSVYDLRDSLGLSISGPPAPLPYKRHPFPGNMKEGHVSDGVFALKVDLRAAGFKGVNLKPSGARVFGPGTRRAVEALQLIHETHCKPEERWFSDPSKVNGEVGAKVWGYLQDLLEWQHATKQHA